jgi:hypothetical protein
MEHRGERELQSREDDDVERDIHGLYTFLLAGFIIGMAVKTGL